MKHEQITLVVLGYVIGFVTAFIGFGLTSADHTEAEEVRYERGGYGLVAKASQDRTDDQHTAIAEAAITNEGLFAKIGNDMRIISAGTIPPEEGLTGYHYAVIESLVSPDGQHLFYCTQIDVMDTHCEGYVYNLADDAVYSVKNLTTDEYMQYEIASLNASWNEDGLLMVNEYRSVDPATPWVVE